MKKVTLGGDRLGSGKKEKVTLHGYERSTHDLGYLWRSTMSAGTLVPFMNEVALPGDTFDINLNADIKTHPTIGPLFGSYKVQLDVFQCPIRLYQGLLHNNKLGIGMNMSKVFLPIIKLYGNKIEDTTNVDIDNYQINPSCILAYLGIRGVAFVGTGDTDEFAERNFNGVPLLAYWDIFKNYYANKQDPDAWVIHNQLVANTETVTTIEWQGTEINQPPADPALKRTAPNDEITIVWATTAPVLSQIVFITSAGNLSAEQIADPYSILTVPTETYFHIKPQYVGILINNWTYTNTDIQGIYPPRLEPFPLSNLDYMREIILAAGAGVTMPFDITGENLQPYSFLLNTLTSGGKKRTAYSQTQEGLAVKTYQSDLFNNWINTDWIDGDGGITEVTAIDTSGGSFTLDTLNLSKKVYNMLNRIAISGGTYDDWLDAVYDHDRIQRAETPIYHGGLIKELVFQEVISNSATAADASTPQPLGTLAGRGILAKKHKGGQVRIRVDEPSYIMGIVSITPRIDYSQGNKWDTHLETMDDLHKPALDQIGFQELITEQMAWWSTSKASGTNTFNTQSAGKQPAWINYMTNVNTVRGNFAIATNEMFMTLNRRYEHGIGATIGDLTTYIDPEKFNHIFAETSLDAQNFWVQIAVDITARRKMSAKVIPNL